MIRRLLIFQIVLLAGLSSILLLPRTPPIKEAALITKLPNFLTLSGWRGGPLGIPSQEERDILAKDTGFFRRNYIREVSMLDQQALVQEKALPHPIPNLVDALHCSIVLSGKDLTNSIHALERCLTAQGFNIPQAGTMKITLRSGQTLPVRRLLCERAEPETKRIARSIAYYWFVGHDSVTSNHIHRGLKDFKDRVLGGYDQRWGYMTVTAYLSPGNVITQTETDPQPYPQKNEHGQELLRRPLSPEQADKLVEEFITDIGPDIIIVDQIKDWPAE